MRDTVGVPDVPELDAIDVLTRSGPAREALCAAVSTDDAAIDARLVSDLLRERGRVGDTLRTRRALVELCTLLRAIDAALAARITLAELRDGLALHAARTDRFRDFHDARVLLRTVEEVLEHHADAARAAHAQLRMLHEELREWLVAQLVGAAGVQPPSPAPPAIEVDDPRTPWRVADPALRVAHDGLVAELLHGAAGYPVTGLLGAAWRHDWSAAPVAEEMLGDDPAEVARLADALELLDPRPGRLVQVTRGHGPPWQLHGSSIELLDGLRDSWALPATRRGVELAATPRSGWTIITTSELQFAYVEGAGHHAVLGPGAFVERVVGMAPLEAVARFREHVELLAGEDDEPPPDLLEVATSFGRLRRRSR